MKFVQGNQNLPEDPGQPCLDATALQSRKQIGFQTAVRIIQSVDYAMLRIRLRTEYWVTGLSNTRFLIPCIRDVVTLSCRLLGNSAPMFCLVMLQSGLR